MKKRLSAAALAVLLLLCVTACGGQTPPQPGTDNPAPTSDPGSTPAPSSGPAVQTDWSALTPYEPFRSVEKRWYPDYTDTLIPRADYGQLVPYQSSSLSYTYSWDESGYAYGYERWGLATLDGTIVTDPVFDSVYQMTGYRQDTEETVYAPFWRLVKTVQTEDGPVQRTAIAALDGSWCTPFSGQTDLEATMGVSACETGFLFVDADRGCISVCGPDGRERFSLDRSESSNAEADWWSYYLMDQLSLGEDFLCRQYRDDDYQPTKAVFYRLSDGSLLDTPDILEAYPFSCGLAAALDRESGLWGYLATDGSWAIPPRYHSARGFYRDHAIVYVNAVPRLIDREGTELYELGLLGSYLTQDAGGIYVEDLLWVDRNFELHRLDDGTDYQWYYSTAGGFPYYSTDSALVLLTADGERQLPWTGQLQGLAGDLAIIAQPGETDLDPYTYLVVNISTGEVLLTENGDGYPSMLQVGADPDAAPFLLFSDDPEYRIYSPEGEYLFSSTQWPRLAGGLFLVTDELSSGLRDADGNWVLRLASFGGLEAD